jgi:hypothetical protein
MAVKAFDLDVGTADRLVALADPSLRADAVARLTGGSPYHPRHDVDARLLRGGARRRGDLIGYTFPTIVLRDELDVVALFQPAGTVCKRAGGPRGGPRGRHLSSWDGTHEDVVFERNTVHVHVAGDGFWLIREWDGAGYTGWYINLASPWRRTPIGFDTLDHKLDIEVTDDLSE